jgi:hypothetical protein
MVVKAAVLLVRLTKNHASEASLNCGDTSGLLPAGRSERTSVGRMCSGGARRSGAPRFRAPSCASRGSADGTAGIYAGHRGDRSTCRPQRARGNRLGSCTLPPCSLGSEARDEAVAVSRLLPSRKSTSMLEARKNRR